MKFIIIGVIGVAVSGLLSKMFWDRADPLDRMARSARGRPLGGVVPVWASVINVASFVCLIYGIFEMASR